jgi:hypothetical protein
MGSARPRSCGHLLVATLVAFALAMSIPLYGQTSASATARGSATACAGPADKLHQAAHTIEAIHRQGHPAKSRSILNVGIAVPAASWRAPDDQHVSVVAPHDRAANWHSRTLMDVALGRGPPA